MLIIWFLFLAVTNIYACSVGKNIIEYFESESFHTFEAEWEKHRKPLENAVLTALKEGYGYRGMNVYVRRLQDPHHISNGYYHSDNQVQLILLDMSLKELPHLWMPEVSMPLASNLLHVEGALSKIIVHTTYFVFRNKSDIIYDLSQQNLREVSPFRYQQVQNMGQLAITVEGCKLSASILTTLQGESVNLGHSIFKLSRCQYTFEIFTPGLGSPPVIAKYDPNGDDLSMESILMKPLKAEMIPKLQAAMYSFVNTSSIFGSKLHSLRSSQEEMFSATSAYINQVVRNLNKLTAQNYGGAIEMNDFHISWNDTYTDDSDNSMISLKKMVLTGMDTLYSAHNGGPYKSLFLRIGEEIRYNSLQIKGEIHFKNGVDKGKHDFFVELHDVAVQVSVNVNLMETSNMKNKIQKLKPTKAAQGFEIIGWRSSEFTVPGIKFISTESLVTGYLLSELPKQIIKRLQAVFEEALKEHTDFKHTDKNTLNNVKKQSVEDNLGEINEDQNDDGEENATIQPEVDDDLNVDENEASDVGDAEENNKDSINQELEQEDNKIGPKDEDGATNKGLFTKKLLSKEMFSGKIFLSNKNNKELEEIDLNNASADELNDNNDPSVSNEVEANNSSDEELVSDTHNMFSKIEEDDDDIDEGSDENK